MTLMASRHRTSDDTIDPGPHHQTTAISIADIETKTTACLSVRHAINNRRRIQLAVSAVCPGLGKPNTRATNDPVLSAIGIAPPIDGLARNTRIDASPMMVHDITNANRTRISGRRRTHYDTARVAKKDQ